MSITAKVSRLFKRRKESKPEVKKEESIVDHFKNLEKVRASLREPIDRSKLAMRVFQRTIADVKATVCDVKKGVATFTTGGSVWAFDAKAQTPILRKTDSDGDSENVSSIEQYKAFSNTSENIPDEIYAFYSRGFITWTTCAQFATHEIINRACAVRGEDAVAVGYELSYADEDESGKIADEDKDGRTDAKEAATKDDFLTALQKQTKRMGIDEVLRKLDYNKCVYGIGIAMPTFDGDVDMSLPFNIDAKGLETYTGFTVVEPYWLCPMFDHKDSSDPSSKHFFEPTWWRLPNGKMVHRSWCIKAVNSYVADILKPTYIYGGIPLTQMIYERVFAADKCANEAPMLALTKRLLVVDANIQQVISDPKHVKDLMDVVTYCRTNWGVMFKQPTANINQIDTSLGEYDQLIMTQYQLVASIAQMPATKLLKVTPTGFQSTGEYEWKDWAQSLIDIQEMEFTPLLERHLQLLTRKRGKSVALTVAWNAVDAPTAKEKAEIQSVKSSSLTELLTAGALSVDEVRNILRNDKDGDFTGLSSESPKKDADIMTRLAQEMGDDENPNKAGDAGAPSADEVETGDDAEFERKHKRDRDGRFTRGNTRVVQSILEYAKEKGGRQKFDDKGNHVYAGVRKADGKPWAFPKKSQSSKADERKLSKRNAAHYNGGNVKPDLTHWKANAKSVPFTGKALLSDFKKKDLFVRSVKPKYGVEETVSVVRNKETGRKNKRISRVPVQKSGKPMYDWTVGGRTLSDKEAFALEHALVNAGYGGVLAMPARDVWVRPDYANGVGQICGFRATGDSAWKGVLDARTSVANKNLHLAQINSVYKNADRIIDKIIDDFDSRDDDFGVLAYFQLVSTCRVGSPSSMNDGALDLTPENVTVAGDRVFLDFDAKNGRWHTEFDDKALADWFRMALKNTKKGERIFDTTDYAEYCDYLTDIGEKFGIPRRRSGDGFTSHNLRHMSASLYASREVDKIKIDPKKDPEGYIKALEGVVGKVARHVNDGAGVVFKSYIAPDALWKNARWLYESDERFTPPTGR